jgi:hypothetical protein
MIISAFLPYIIIYGVAVVLMAISMLFYGKGKLNDYIFWLAWIALLVFVGFRDQSVGSDTANYLSSFHHPESGYGENGDTDPGFLMYLYLSHYLLFDQGTLFLLLTALVGLGGIGYVTRKNSAMPVLSLVFFATFGTATIFLFHYLSAVRQTLAEGLFLLSVFFFLGKQRDEYRLLLLQDKEEEEITAEKKEELIPDRNIGLAAILFFIAALIHGSTWAMLPVLFIARFLKFKRWIWATIIVGTYAFGVQSIVSVQDIVFAIFSLFGRSSDNYLARYGNYGDWGHGEVEMSLINPNMWPFCILALYLIFRSDKVFIKSQWVILFLLSVVFNNLFNDNIIWSRLFLYISLLSLFVIPNVIALQKKRWIDYGFIAVFVAYSIMRATKILIAIWIAPEGNVVIPYEFTDFTI